MAAEIVTLCGSRKYAGVFKTVARTLSKRGIIVLAPVFSADIATTAAIQGLRRTHFKKLTWRMRYWSLTCTATLANRPNKKSNTPEGNIKRFATTQL